MSVFADSESEKALDAKLLAKIFKVDPQDILEVRGVCSERR